MKKSDQTIDEPVNSEEEALAENASTRVLRANIPVEMAEVVLFTMGWWGDFPQWKCTQCPWDTLEGEVAFMEHWRAYHAPAPEPQTKRIIPIYDRYGNEVK